MRTRRGRYDVIGQIGSGGSSELFLAVDPDRGERVVLKVLRSDLVSGSAAPRCLEIEATVGELLVGAGCREVVRLFGTEVFDGIPALSLELVDGPSLSAARRLLAARGERVAVPLALAISARVASALAALHALVHPATGLPLGLVHRDVAAPNVLLSRDGDVKLADFGVVQLPVDGTGAFAPLPRDAHVFIGHPSTIAPEALRTDVVDVRADLYAVGVLLWETIAARRLWPVDSASDLALRLDGPAPRLGDEVPADVVDLVASLLEREPHRRPPSATALRDALLALAPASTAEIANLVRSLGLPSLRA